MEPLLELNKRQQRIEKRMQQTATTLARGIADMITEASDSSEAAAAMASGAAMVSRIALGGHIAAMATVHMEVLDVEAFARFKDLLGKCLDEDFQSFSEFYIGKELQ
jgi:hypothetical protein